MREGTELNENEGRFPARFILNVNFEFPALWSGQGEGGGAKVRAKIRVSPIIRDQMWSIEWRDVHWTKNVEHVWSLISVTSIDRRRSFISEIMHSRLSNIVNRMWIVKPNLDLFSVWMTQFIPRLLTHDRTTRPPLEKKRENKKDWITNTSNVIHTRNLVISSYYLQLCKSLRLNIYKWIS